MGSLAYLPSWMQWSTDRSQEASFLEFLGRQAEHYRNCSQQGFRIRVWDGFPYDLKPLRCLPLSFFARLFLHTTNDTSTVGRSNPNAVDYPQIPHGYAEESLYLYNAERV